MPRAPRLCPECKGKKKRVTSHGRCEDHQPPRSAEAWARQVPYRKDPGWEKTRLDILRRDGYSCVLCGARARFVDHITPKYLGGSDHSSNLQALCNVCHGRKSASEGHQALKEKRRQERLQSA